MVQNPKGGGLSSSFGSSQQLGGVQKTTDFLDKSTWSLGAILIALILLSSLSFTGGSLSGPKVLGEDETSIPTTTVPTGADANKPATTATPSTEQTPAKTEETSK